MSEELVENETILEEEIEEPTEKRANEKKAQKASSRQSGFYVRFMFCILLFFLAAFLIRPHRSDIFYIVYFIIFIVFSLGTLFCLFAAHKSISYVTDFFYEFKKSKGRKIDLVSKNEGVQKICEAYKESFLLNETYDKTRSNADLYFGGETYLQDVNTFPLQSFLKIIPGTFIGFGILGTFIGFAEGLSHINISNSQSLLDGVQVLLDGLENAFNTSIVGVLASMFLNFCMIHPLFNTLDRSAKELCDYLDTKFFVSEVDALSVTDSNGRRIPFPETMGIVLEKLEQISSNINQMGSLVGDQVTQSVKATLDKTIEKIIQEEIEKLKEELRSSIALLQECESHLQNAPVHLKEAAEKMQGAAIKNNELFNNWFTDYAGKMEAVGKEMVNIKETLSVMPADFGNIDKSVSKAADRLSENQLALETALHQSSEAFAKASSMTESLNKTYEIQSERIEKMVSAFSNLLESYNTASRENKELLTGLKGLDTEIANIFTQINEHTKNYGDILGKSLSDYFKEFYNATKDVSAQFAEATLVLSEEIAKMNKAQGTK